MRDIWANPIRWCHISAIVGSILWLVLLGALPVSGDDISTATYLTLLALLVVAPLTIGLAAPAPAAPRRLFWLAVAVQPAASLLAVTSFYVPSGPLAALLTLGWLLLCALVALLGLERLYRHGRRIEEVCIGAGLLLLPIGGAWLYQARAGSMSGGGGGGDAVLAAMNAHYALFATPVLAGMVGRALPCGRTWPWRTFRASACGIIVCTPLLAIGGIVAPPLDEVDAVARTILAAALLALALLTVLVVAPRTRPFLAAALLSVSGVAMTLPIFLTWSGAASALAGGGGVGGAPTPTSHGVANALGFVLCGLLAWSIIRPAAR